MVYDFVTSIYTRPEMGEHILVGGLDAEASYDTADPDATQEGVSPGESTEALARVSHRFLVLEDGHIARGYAGCAVGHMMATLITEGPGGHPDLPTFRLARLPAGKPIRGTYGDWLIC
ncbi:MAG: hypothetical protein ACRELW_05445 [Candidatus Rokuibacteriota bacterium]